MGFARLGSLLAFLAATGCNHRAAARADPESPACQLVLAAPGPRGTTPIRVETVAEGLDVPWGIAFLPGGDWLVTERPGRLRLLREGRLVPEPIAKLDVDATEEGGLLGIAVAPDFATTGLVYLYMTVREGGASFNRVTRHRLSEDHLSLDRTPERVLLDRIPAARYHDGGRLRFGPDGMLYVGTGDGREPERAQSMASLNGKLLRLRPDGSIPADNPFPGSPVFLLGIRNTQGFDWLSPTTLAVVDHGPSGEYGLTGLDEVNVARAGDNLGWPAIHGCESRPGFVTPSLTWEKAVPPGGAALYTGDSIPEWRGSLLVGTLRSKSLLRVVFDSKDPSRVAAHEVYLPGDPPSGYGRLREVVMGPDKQLYVTTSNCDARGACPKERDRILRITR